MVKVEESETIRRTYFIEGLCVREISRHFSDLLAVDHLTLEVYRSEVFGFTGHNGAGKTITLRLLNGVLSFTDKTAHVLGLSPLHDRPALRRRTGVLTETLSLEPPVRT